MYKRYEFHFLLIFLIILIPLAIFPDNTGLVESDSYEFEENTLYYNLYVNEDDTIELLLWTNTDYVEISLYSYYQFSSNVQVNSSGIRFKMPMPHKSYDDHIVIHIYGYETGRERESPMQYRIYFFDIHYEIEAQPEFPSLGALSFILILMRWILYIK